MKLQLASLPRRMLSIDLDRVLIYFLSADVVFIYSALFDLKNLQAYQESIALLIAGLTSTFLYPIISFVIEHWLGRTPGMIILQLQVVQLDGSRPTFWQLLLRHFLRWFPPVWLSFLFIKNGPLFWHDLVSRTRIISTRPE